MSRLTEEQVQHAKDLVQDAINCGNTPDWDIISDTIGAPMTQIKYDKISGALRWTEEQKEKLVELWKKHCENPDWDMFCMELQPHKLRQIKSELKFQTKKDPSLKRFE